MYKNYILYNYILHIIYIIIIYYIYYIIWIQIWYDKLKKLILNLKILKYTILNI